MIKAFSSVIVGALVAFAGPAHSFELNSPVDCALGETCFIQNYVDRDPGPGVRDARCGPRSYNGHKGTDFSVPDVATMKRGITCARGG